MPIFRAKYIATRTEGGYKKGQVVGDANVPEISIYTFGIGDDTSLADAKAKKRSVVGPGRKVIAVTSTRLKGTTTSRASLPRNKRFGSRYY